MSDKDGGSAFPSSGEQCDGMSLRDYFAGQALVGLMATPGALGINRITVVEGAYATADAMLAERSKERP